MNAQDVIAESLMDSTFHRGQEQYAIDATEAILAALRTAAPAGVLLAITPDGELLTPAATSVRPNQGRLRQTETWYRFEVPS